MCFSSLISVFFVYKFLTQHCFFPFVLSFIWPLLPIWFVDSQKASNCLGLKQFHRSNFYFQDPSYSSFSSTLHFHDYFIKFFFYTLLILWPFFVAGWLKDEDFIELLSFHLTLMCFHERVYWFYLEVLQSNDSFHQ